MEISVFSVLMTILWSSVLIVLFYFWRTKTGLLYRCSISTVILLYLFCAIRVALPIELPWTRVIRGGGFYNAMRNVLYYKIGFVRLFDLLLAVWFIGIAYHLLKHLIEYHNVMRYFKNIPQAENEEGNQILAKMGNQKQIKVINTPTVKSPCCIGIFRKMILLPDKAYDKDELWYILLHEYTHLCNNDLLLKKMIMVLCWIYWWNPIVYLLRKELDQSMEIRCDLSVVRHLKEQERAKYLATMLNAFQESRQTNEYVGAVGIVDHHSESLLERFRIVADMKVVQKKHANVVAAFVMMLVLAVSYSFILQSSYEVPISEIETGENAYYMTPDNTYIIKRGDTYVLCTEDEESIISEKMAEMMLKEGFVMKGGE